MKDKIENFIEELKLTELAASQFRSDSQKAKAEMCRIVINRLNEILNGEIREREEESCDLDLHVPLQVKKTIKLQCKVINEEKQDSSERT